MSIAVVTGGAGAFGSAAAEALAEAGHTVVLADLDAERAQAAAERIRSTGSNASAVQVDLTDEASINAAVAEIVAQHGTINVVVNNAGSLPVGDSTVTDAALFDFTLSLNLRGAYLFTRAVMPHLKRSAAGRIVMMGSRTWLSGGNPAYTASKAGMVGLARAFAQELAPFGGTVNVVAPGPVDTDLVTGDADTKRANFDTWAKQTPLGRVATPDDVAAAVVFFASQGAAFITGEVLHVAGGLQLAPKL